MPIWDETLLLGRIGMTGRAIVVVLLIGLLLFAAMAGDFVETWRNGATL